MAMSMSASNRVSWVVGSWVEISCVEDERSGSAIMKSVLRGSSKLNADQRS